MHTDPQLAVTVVDFALSSPLGDDGMFHSCANVVKRRHYWYVMIDHRGATSYEDLFYEILGISTLSFTVNFVIDAHICLWPL
tara:strand:- start:2158 stop:2403 length:246 start_codon:yes stop_codon:yes gene_type:complete